MRILHVRPYGFDVGSVYKYTEMFRRIGDVTDVIVPPGDGYADLLEAITREKPDIGFMGGDWWEHWRAFDRAGIPYVLAEHDVVTLRRSTGGAHERAMLENASAVLFTSEDHRDYCAARYRLPHTEIVHLRPLLEQVDFKPLPQMKGRHLVYAGGIQSWRQRHGQYGYRCYQRIFERAMEAGWTMHVYPCYLTAPETIAEYAALGCVMHEQVPHRDLGRELSVYTAGLQAYADEGCDPLAISYCMTCRPNKTWDYLAAGIPTIGYNAGATAEIYRDRWGVVIDDLAHLTDIDSSSLPTRAKVLRHRSRERMDDDLPAFKRLARAAADARVKMEKQQAERARTRSYDVIAEFVCSGRRYAPGDTAHLSGEHAERALKAKVIALPVHR